MMTPETLAAALRVAQHGARSAMLSARLPLTEDARQSPAEGRGIAPTPAGSGHQAEVDGLR